MDLEVVTRPSSADVLGIVSVEELKLNMRVTNSVENDVFQRAILAAYDFLANPENGWLNRSLISQTFKLKLPGFVREQTYSLNGGPAQRWVPTKEFELPKPPLVSVQSVKYLYEGVQETLAADQYTIVKPSAGFGRIVQAYNVTWPTTIDVHPQALEIAFTAGYGNAATVKTTCPGIVQAIMMLAGDAYRNREDTYAEPRLVAVNRRTLNGVRFYAGRYRFLNKHA